MNAKAKYLLTCALSKSEYDKLISCDSAKEIWDKLQVLHEGTNQLKETKLSILVHQYNDNQIYAHHKSVEGIGQKILEC